MRSDAYSTEEQLGRFHYSEAKKEGRKDKNDSTDRLP
jgi:hypothetical protein